MNLPTITISSSCSSIFPFCSLKLSNRKWRKRIPSAFTSRISSPISPLPNPSRLSISAHFSRRIKRQNYLRKKLTQHHQQVNQNPTIPNPCSENSDEIIKNNPIFQFIGNPSTASLQFGDETSVEIEEPGEELQTKVLGESVLWNKLENWVEQYKKDTEFWGIGTAPIFTVYQDSEGRVNKVDVNKDEILKRSRIDPALFRDPNIEENEDIKAKISFADDLAKEMESGKSLLPKNSSVAKFLVTGGKSSTVNGVSTFALNPGLFKKLPRVGFVLLCGFFFIWAVKKMFTTGKDEEEYTSLEKEMLRRKIKARKEKQMTVKGEVEVMQGTKESDNTSLEKPWLDKQEVVNSIKKAREYDSKLPDHFQNQRFENAEFHEKIEEIRKMARHARELEKGQSIQADGGESGDYPTSIELPDEKEVAELKFFGDIIGKNDLNVRDLSGSVDSTAPSDNNGVHTVSSSLVNHEVQTSNRNLEPPDIISSSMENVCESKHDVSSTVGTEKSVRTSGQSCKPSEIPVTSKSRVILSVKEAREYLLQKSEKLNAERDPEDEELPITLMEKEIIGDINQASDNTSEDSSFKQNESTPTSNFTEASKNNGISELGDEVAVQTEIPETLSHGKVNGRTAELEASPNNGGWLEKNFHEFEPVIKKIQAGFRDNYIVAKEKSDEELNLKSQMFDPESNMSDSELEWMKDERLKEIVFKVRENELAGRDPFCQMDDEDKLVFFNGLEKKVDQENKRLLDLHEWLHSNIENLDYGADGISLYDPPEKFIPRWKGPPPERSTDFHDYFVEQKKVVAESIKNSNLIKKEIQDLPQGLQESPSSNKIDSKAISSHDAKAKTPRTIIESSDGSIRAGKKSGKEYWQHTKKWSEGFLESYNAETDPETKTVMKDIGKDLDRWITEREIQEAANVMDNLPEKGKKLIKEKLDKVKREMELFGPQAVVSKYCEYADEKEEDYLWWLDLPCILCIELYTNEEGKTEVGLYSLEMAADLELDPKQYHVIAFEDAGDSKNFCYIIQAHMEMLGSGNAFVIARPPKDAFRDAKANGFNVTVIRKGQLQLNIDMTLEEVEEAITEIGSKMYHEKIMRERSLDVNTVMKGLFGTGKPTKNRRRSRKKFKKPTSK